MNEANETADWCREAAGCAARIHADGLTIWLAGADGCLVAVCNPLEAEIVGLRQPVRSGLISQVYLTGQAIIEADPAGNPAHDPTIDLRTGRRCRTVMAVPWAGEHGREGVISAVLFADGGGGGCFGLPELAQLVELGRTIGNGGGR